MNKQWEIQTGREKPSLFQQRCGSSLRKHPFLLALRRWRRFARRRARRNGCFRWLCGSRDSTNQNALFVEWFSRLRRVVFRGVYGEIFALFQACVGNFYTIRPWKYVGTLNLDSSYVTFKYFAFLSVCDKFELLGHVQAAMMIWVLFLPFFLDSLLVTVSDFIGLFWSSCYFNLSSLQISGSTRVYPR